jgi:hypothetical protein
MQQFWAAIGGWFVSGLTSSNVITILIALGALWVSILAFRRSRPEPPLQPDLQPVVGHSGKDALQTIVKREDGSEFGMHYASVKVTVLNAGIVPAADVRLFVAATKHHEAQAWRLGQIDPNEHPERIVEFASSDEPDGHDVPRIWLTWTEYPGKVTKELDISLANDSRKLI